MTPSLGTCYFTSILTWSPLKSSQFQGLWPPLHFVDAPKVQREGTASWGHKTKLVELIWTVLWSSLLMLTLLGDLGPKAARFGPFLESGSRS